MSIDKELYDAIESNNEITDKVGFYENLKFIKEVYNTYGVEYNFNNILDVIKNIKVEYSDKTRYDKDSNVLTIGPTKDNDSQAYDVFKSFLQITSQNGLVRIDENGNKEWEYFNELFMDKIILYNSGVTKEKQEDDELYEIDVKKEKEDELMYEITKAISSQKLVEYFAYGKGNELYDEYFKQNENIQSI